MKTYLQSLIILFLIVSIIDTMHAQSSPGIKMGKKSSTRAVIIGISDYADDGIPDLQFAHRDAQAFAEYLKSPAGGGLSDDDIKIYVNDQATGGNIHKALYWLITESKEDDNCIIYFSGHGDVETIYEDEPGHLLIHDSPASIYQINSLRVDDLNRIVKTLSTQKKAKVKLYTDACRSGKLAGSEINGSQATAAALNKQYGNEVKILSCQANEYSVEGPQWGEGRGVFSYHLIDGLIGLADTDNDHIVNLLELQRYIEDAVHESLSGTKQTPVTIGDRNTQLSLVHAASLEKLIQNKNLDGLMASVDQDPSLLPKGNNNEKLIELFYKAIEGNNLLIAYDPDSEKSSSAEYYYDLISQSEELSNQLPILKGDYIAQLQDDAQKAINLYLSVDLEEMKKRWSGEDIDFRKYAEYLSKACDLIEQNHYIYPQIKSKQIYFDVLSKRLEYEGKKVEPNFYVDLQEELKIALVYQDRAPYLYNELGLLYERNKEYERALAQFDIAIEQSPKWALPYNNKGFVYNKLSRYEEALDMSNIALLISPNFVSSLRNIADAYRLQSNYDKALEYELKYLEIFKDDYHMLNNTGYLYALKEDIENAIFYYNKSIEQNPNFALAYINKGLAYITKKDYKNAIKAFNDLLGNGYEDANLYTNIGYCYLNLKNYKQADYYYNKAISINKNHISRLYLAESLLEQNESEKAIDSASYYVNNINANDSDGYYALACAYAMQEDLEEFQSNMYKAIERGFSNKEKMEESNFLSSIRNTQVYQDILNKL